VYVPLFGKKTLFNHLNVVAVDPWLPPGVAPAAFYAISALAIAIAVRRVARRIGAGARTLLDGEDAAPVDE
jgi:hypothetical protein